MRIVISMGDPAGVGPEIIVKALGAQLFPGVSFLIIGDEHYFNEAQRLTGVTLDYCRVSSPEFSAGKITLFQPQPWKGKYNPFGLWSTQTGEKSLGYVRIGAGLCLQRSAEALVTAPICKSAWKAADCEFPGHTELLGELCGIHDEVMLLVGGGLRVALVTTHVPVAALPDALSSSRICRILEILDSDLKRRFCLQNPRIAVLGFNPHAGEDGNIGSEEIEIINPAVAKMRERGILASYAIPADTAFHRMLGGEFEAILAMYHDQGLGPLKTLAFDSGVNITLGLPLIRTSVDHGTAFDIAGTGSASCESMLEAIRTAVLLVTNERSYQVKSD